MLSHNSDMILPRCIARVRRHPHDTRATDTADFLGLCVMRPRDLFVAKRETVHFNFFLCSSLNLFSLFPFPIPTLVSYRLPGNAVRHHIPACPWEWLPGDRWRTEDAYAKDDPRFPPHHRHHNPHLHHHRRHHHHHWPEFTARHKEDVPAWPPSLPRACVSASRPSPATWWPGRQISSPFFVFLTWLHLSSAG